MKSTLLNFRNRTLMLVSGMLVGGVAQAAQTGNGGGTAISASGFDDFEATLLSWVNGPLGVGLAVTSLMIGGGTGIIQSSPLPALAGLVLAAFFAWGPSVIITLVAGGAMVG